MNERIRELMIKADYPAPELALRAQALVELIIMDVANKLEPVLASEILELYGVEE